MVPTCAQNTTSSSKEKGATTKQEADDETRTVIKKAWEPRSQKPYDRQSSKEARTPLNYSNRQAMEEQIQKLHTVQAVS